MPTMLAPTQRPSAVAVAISRLNGLAIDYGKLHNAFDREQFRVLCRQLYEVLKPLLVCGIPDYSIDSAIRDHFQRFFGWDEVKNGELSINVNYLSDDMEADAVLSLIGYNKFHDHIEEHPDGSSTVYRKEILKPGAIADSTLGLFLPEYWRYDGGSIGNVAPRKYAEFCTSLVAILEQAGEVKTPTSTDAIEQADAPKTKGGKVNDDSLPPVADRLQHIRPAVFAHLNRGEDAEPRKAVLRIAATLKRERFAKGQKGLWKSVLDEFKGSFKSSAVRQGIETRDDCENVWRAYRKWIKENHPDYLAAEIDLLYGHL